MLCNFLDGFKQHPNNMKRKYYYYTLHIGALPVPVCGIIANIDQISICFHLYVCKGYFGVLGIHGIHFYTVHSYL
jgi:hypothetical protein